MAQPSITLTNLSYQAAQNAFGAGTISIGAKAVSLFNDPKRDDAAPVLGDRRWLHRQL